MDTSRRTGGGTHFTGDTADSAIGTLIETMKTAVSFGWDVLGIRILDRHFLLEKMP
jgi:hypothetical protein